MIQPKILLLDIESTGLDADMGQMLVFGYGWFNALSGRVKHVYTKRIDDFSEYEKDRLNDAPLVQFAFDRLGEADMVVTWYGGGFDLPYIRTRGMIHAFYESMPEPPHVDLWRTARFRHKATNNRLDNWQRLLGLKTKKTRFGKYEWRRAMAGYKDGIDYIDEHCRRDIVVLGDAYEAMRHEVVPHPNLPLILGFPNSQLCPVCTSKKTYRDGFRFTRVSRQYQWRCSNCGAKSYSLTGSKSQSLR